MPQEKRELKATILTVAGGMLIWGVQMAIQAQYIEGVLGIAVAAGLFWVYEHVQLSEYNDLANQILEEFDEERMKEVIDQTGDSIRDVMDDAAEGQE